MSNVMAFVFASKAAGSTFSPIFQAAGIDWQAVGAWIVPFLVDLITFLILGSLLIWLLPKPFERWTEKTKQAPLKAFGTGILLFFGGYLAVILGVLLILGVAIFLYFIQFNGLGGIILGIGLPAVGVFLGALSLFVAYISKLVVVFVIGKLILARLYPKALAHRFWPLALGLVIYLLIAMIPWLGWVVGVIATLIGLGAIWLGWQQKPAETALPTAAAELVVDPGE